MTTRRQERVAELLQEELSILISTELTDPRLADAMVTVTHVDVSQDLRNARVYVEHALGPAASKHVLDALYHSETFLRKSVVATLNMRFVPHFTFTVDETTVRGQRVDQLLDAIRTDAVTNDAVTNDTVMTNAVTNDAVTHDAVSDQNKTAENHESDTAE
jgi:ribosome-binding factor A